MEGQNEIFHMITTCARRRHERFERLGVEVARGCKSVAKGLFVETLGVFVSSEMHSQMSTTLFKMSRISRWTKLWKIIFYEREMKCDTSSICCISEMFAMNLVLSFDDVMKSYDFVYFQSGSLCIWSFIRTSQNATNYHLITKKPVDFCDVMEMHQDYGNSIRFYI